MAINVGADLVKINFYPATSDRPYPAHSKRINYIATHFISKQLYCQTSAGYERQQLNRPAEKKFWLEKPKHFKRFQERGMVRLKITLNTVSKLTKLASMFDGLHRFVRKGDSDVTFQLIN